MREDWYDVAQICLNGHVINASSRRYPQYNKKFCDKCGAATITSCQDCNTEIQGRFYSPHLIDCTRYKIPSFCYNCGKPYPWTKTKLKAAQELALEMENLSPDEKEVLTKSIDDIVKDTPETSLAATRIKKLLSKAGKTAASAFRDLVVDIASETAKKLLKPEL